MQSQLAVAAQRDEVLFRIIAGLTAKFLVVTPSLTSTTQLTQPADATQDSLPETVVRRRLQPHARGQTGRRGLTMLFR
jgi:hypothetical protein